MARAVQVRGAPCERGILRELERAPVLRRELRALHGSALDGVEQRAAPRVAACERGQRFATSIGREALPLREDRAR